jgi:hypothetical protein
VGAGKSGLLQQHAALQSPLTRCAFLKQCTVAVQAARSLLLPPAGVAAWGCCSRCHLWQRP